MVPEGDQEAAPTDGGSWTGGGRKGLLHTTEGRTAADAFAAFKNKGSWPHFTASFAGNRFQIWQHIPLNRASRSLGNPAGGVETNRGNVIQIELVGTADERLAEHLDAPSLYVENWPAKYLAEIAAWMRWVEANFAYPASQSGFSSTRHPLAPTTPTALALRIGSSTQGGLAINTPQSR